jgi:SnoaL-like domain
MDDEARRVRIRQFVEAVNTGDLGVLDAIYHDDVVIQWPQSGEVIHGKQNIRELRQAYPIPPTATLGRIIGSGDLWAMEMLFDYDGERFHVVVIHQWRDGLVASETSYYAAPFEAPAWRAKWVADESATTMVGVREGG